MDEYNHKEFLALKSEFENLRKRYDDLEMTSVYLFQRHIQMLDAANIICGSNNGTKIGTATTEKFAFHGATPVTQRASLAQAAVATTGSTNTNPYGYTTSGQADAIVTLVNEIRAALVEKGIIKGSA